MKHRLLRRICLRGGLLLALAAVVLGSFEASCCAHPLNNGYSTLTIDRAYVHYQLFIPEPSLLMFDANKDDRLSSDELEQQKAQLSEYIRQHIRLQNDGNDMTFSLLSMERTERESIPGVEFTLDYASSSPVNSLNIDYSLLFDDVDPLHLNFTIILNGDDVDQTVFDALHRSYHYEPMTKPSMLNILWQYLSLGVEHIITGYDHLLFLVSLIVIAARFADLLKIVTAFTVAHSITLFLAATDRIAYSPQWIEAAIALTIAYVALENMFSPRLKRRWLLTFFFGLIHGMGFASALKEIGLPTRYFVSSLLMFNAGVEAGQLCIVAVLLPILLKLRKFAWYRQMTIAVSSAVFLLAMYWLLQRTGVLA